MLYNNKEKRTIRNFVKKINTNYRVHFEDKEFEVDVDNQIIYIGRQDYDMYAQFYYNWYSKEFPTCKDANWWLISLLHEIGHIETKDLNTSREREEMLETLTLLEEMGISEEDINIIYFQIPNEYKATKWAIEYYKANKSKCEQLAKLIKV